jgi:hypothetical protein
MTTHITFLESTSANLSTEVIYAIQGDAFFARSVVPPASNGTAAVSEIALGQSRATGSVTLLDVYEHEIAQQIRENQKLIGLLREWISNYPKDPDPDLQQQKREFERDRPSQRRLFRW